MNLIRDTDDIGDSGFYRQVFKSIEKEDDYTVKSSPTNPSRA